MFDVTNKQSLINLVSDEDNSRKIKRSWMKELMFKAIGNKHPVMVLGKLYSYRVDCGPLDLPWTFHNNV